MYCGNILGGIQKQSACSDREINFNKRCTLLTKSSPYPLPSCTQTDRKPPETCRSSVPPTFGHFCHEKYKYIDQKVGHARQVLQIVFMIFFLVLFSHIIRFRLSIELFHVHLLLFFLPSAAVWVSFSGDFCQFLTTNVCNL